jgi:hypothetical protein
MLRAAAASLGPMGTQVIGAGPPRLAATRYVTALREGGSLPALVEAEDDGLYVVKMRGAGQGPRALVAELIAGEMARAAGLPVPDLALVDLDADLGRAEPDPEIQDLLRASAGLNLGMDLLPGALAYDPAAGQEVPAEQAADVVWLDALVTNVDRTAVNPNLLVWHGRLWLIDHGAALYGHHRDWRLEGAAARPFPAVADHVLLPVAGPIDAADARLAPLLAPEVVGRIVDLVPGEWLQDEPGVAPQERRRAYRDHLNARLTEPRAFAREAEDARRRVA